MKRSWRLWAADRSTTGPPRCILQCRAGATPHTHTHTHKYNTVLYSKINRHRVPAGRPRNSSRSRGKDCVRGYAKVMPQLCHAPSRTPCLLPASGGRYRAVSLITPAHQPQGVPAADGPQSPDRHMDKGPCQATALDTCRAEARAFLHRGKSVTLRPKVMRARGAVVPIPGRCRSTPTVVERAPAPAMPPRRHSAALRPAFLCGTRAHENICQ